MDKTSAKNRLVAVVRPLAAQKRAELERSKREGFRHLERPDFIWRCLLESFATMGSSSGWKGLIADRHNYRRVTYTTLAALTPRARKAQVRQVCREAGIRWPDKKSDYILGCFERVKALGGLKAAKRTLLAHSGREAKMAFLQTFPGIGPKYARDVMMGAYHEEFRDSIALDARIRAISRALGLSFTSYAEHESFYLRVARDAKLNGWELDRLLYRFRDEVEDRLASSRRRS